MMIIFDLQFFLVILDVYFSLHRHQLFWRTRLDHGQGHKQSQKRCQADVAVGVWKAEEGLGRYKMESGQDGATFVISWVVRVGSKLLTH